jgi:hypothetical protein
MLPSSHCVNPSPHEAVRQAFRHVSVLLRSPSSHCSTPDCEPVAAFRGHAARDAGVVVVRVAVVALLDAHQRKAVAAARDLAQPDAGVAVAHVAVVALLDAGLREAVAARGHQTRPTQASVLLMLPSSHCSTLACVNPSPHAAAAHVFRHASLLHVLPSSHASGPFFTLSPHYGPSPEQSALQDPYVPFW